MNYDVTVDNVEDVPPYQVNDDTVAEDNDLS